MQSQKMEGGIDKEYEGNCKRGMGFMVPGRARHGPESNSWDLLSNEGEGGSRISSKVVVFGVLKRHEIAIFQKVVAAYNNRGPAL